MFHKVNCSTLRSDEKWNARAEWEPKWHRSVNIVSCFMILLYYSHHCRHGQVMEEKYSNKPKYLFFFNHSVHLFIRCSSENVKNKKVGTQNKVFAFISFTNSLLNNKFVIKWRHIKTSVKLSPRPHPTAIINTNFKLMDQREISPLDKRSHGSDVESRKGKRWRCWWPNRNEKEWWENVRSLTERQLLMLQHFLPWAR